jgi:hypothetical protein
MSRHLRFIPEGGALVEVTCRTIQGRLLLRPSPQLNDIFLGVLGRAQSRLPLEIVAYCCLSSQSLSPRKSRLQGRRKENFRSETFERGWAPGEGAHLSPA